MYCTVIHCSHLDKDSPPWFLWNAGKKNTSPRGIQAYRQCMVSTAVCVLERLQAASFRISPPLERDRTDSGILCFLHRSLFESPKVKMVLTKVEVFPLLLTLQLILPLVSGSALGISISLCDPGPCAPTAVCQVLDNFKDHGQSVNNKIWEHQPPDSGGSQFFVLSPNYLFGVWL